jgi:hypothetical protein
VNFNNPISGLVTVLGLQSNLEQAADILALVVTPQSGGGGYPVLLVGGTSISLGTFEKDKWYSVSVSIDNDSLIFNYAV